MAVGKNIYCVTILLYDYSGTKAWTLKFSIGLAIFSIVVIIIATTAATEEEIKWIQEIERSGLLADNLNNIQLYNRRKHFLCYSAEGIKYFFLSARYNPLILGWLRFGNSAFRFCLNSENNSRKMLPLKSEPPETMKAVSANCRG